MFRLPACPPWPQINEFVKRLRALKIHVLIMGHLKDRMPAMFGKEKKQKKLLDLLEDNFVRASRPPCSTALRGPWDRPHAFRVASCLTRSAARRSSVSTTCPRGTFRTRTGTATSSPPSTSQSSQRSPRSSSRRVPGAACPMPPMPRVDLLRDADLGPLLRSGRRRCWTTCLLATSLP